MVSTATPAPPANTWGTNGQLNLPPSVLALLANGGVQQPTPAPLPTGSWNGGTFSPPGSLLDTLAQGGAPVRTGSPLGGGNTVSGENREPTPDKFESGLKQAGFGNGDEDPSLYATIKNHGSLSNWAEQGGPDLGAQLAPKLEHGSAFDPLGILKDWHSHSDNNYGTWGTLADNAKNAQAADWGAYVDSYPDLQKAYETVATDNPRAYQLLLKSFDLDGDGKLSKGEYGQAHYYAIGGQKEGRTITPLVGTPSNLGGNTPNRVAPGTTPTLDQLQAMRLNQPGAQPGAANPPGPVNDPTIPPGLLQYFQMKGPQ